MISSRFFNRVRMAAAAIIGIAYFLPLYWFVLSALRPEDEIFKCLSPGRTRRIPTIFYDIGGGHRRQGMMTVVTGAMRRLQIHDALGI